MKTLLLIDANALVHRTFHALPPLTAQGGRLVNALYGVSSIILKIWKEERPDFAAALFDHPKEPTFRKKEYKEYKAQRPETPEGLVDQLAESRNLFDQFKIPTFEAPGFEADDILGTAVEMLGKELKKGEIEIKKRFNITSQKGN